MFLGGKPGAPHTIKLAAPSVALFALVCIAVTLALGAGCRKADPVEGDYVINELEDPRFPRRNKIGELRIQANQFTMWFGDRNYEGTWKREGDYVELLDPSQGQLKVKVYFKVKVVSDDLLEPVDWTPSETFWPWGEIRRKR
ncbi:MAG: hypothetical protein H0W86_00910 [Armatimonadetes bacterium]|nr:hypothetical protein [Armatimonadota bacterium]